MKSNSFLFKSKPIRNEIESRVMTQNYFKYNATPAAISIFNSDLLIYNIPCHLVATFKDYLVYGDTSEFLQKAYSTKENKDKLLYFPTFYAAYLRFYCRPFLINKSINKICHKRGELQAQVYYSNKYGVEGLDNGNIDDNHDDNEARSKSDEEKEEIKDKPQDNNEVFFDEEIIKKLNTDNLNTLSNHDEKEPLLYLNLETQIKPVEGFNSNSNNNSLEGIINVIEDEKEQDLNINNKENKHIESTVLLNNNNKVVVNKKLGLIGSLESCKNNENNNKTEKHKEEEKKFQPNKSWMNKIQQIKTKSRNININVHSKTYNTNNQKALEKLTQQNNIRKYQNKNTNIHLKTNRNFSSSMYSHKTDLALFKTTNANKSKPKKSSPIHFYPLSLHEYPIKSEEELKKLTEALIYENRKYYLKNSSDRKKSSPNIPCSDIALTKNNIIKSNRDFNKKIYDIKSRNKDIEKQSKTKQDDKLLLYTKSLTKHSTVNNWSHKTLQYNSNLMSNKSNTKHCNQINYHTSRGSNISNKTQQNNHAKVIFTSNFSIQSVSYIKRNQP